MKTNKRLHFDVETTGLNSKEHCIVQLAGLIEIDGQIVDTFNFKIKPHRFDNISPEALKVTGLTIEELQTYPESSTVYFNLIKLFERYINRFDRSDKFIPIAYNGKFDMDFLEAFFLHNHDKYFGSWMSRYLLDPLALAKVFFMEGNIPIKDFHLSTVCAHFDISLNAHDALEDVTAMRELYRRMIEELGITPLPPAQTNLFNNNQ